jgi:hypothetical protein
MSDKLDILSQHIESLSDDDLAEAMMRHPETIKRAQKAIAEARRKEAENFKAQAAASGSALSFDAKAWQKAKRLLTGPYNDANAAELKDIFKTTDPSISPPSEPSLMVIALEYLAERQQVDISWPTVVFNAGCKMETAEVGALCALIHKRGGGASNLGEAALDMLRKSLGRPFDWVAAEKELQASKPTLFASSGSGLSDFLRQNTLRDYYNTSPSSRGLDAWKAFENLARQGCAAPKNPAEFWVKLASAEAEDDRAGDAKADAFEPMIARGWCDSAPTHVTDNLRASASDLINCGSRAALNFMALDSSAGAIFGMLCDREAEIGFERYDKLGRSRLFFLNERLRGLSRNDAEPAQRKILLQLAQRCLELGDSPESVNCQNPLVRASHADLASVLSTAIEAREIRGSFGAAPASRRKSAL